MKNIKVIISNGKKRVNVKIDLINRKQPHEMKVNADGNSFHIIFGRYINGGFLCIPNWAVGCELADFSDVFWNTESILRSMEDERKAEIIATAIAKVNPYLERGDISSLY